MAHVPPLADYRHCQEPPWTLRPRKRAKVRGSVRKTKGQSRELWRLTRRPVPKGLSLRFELDTNAPKPYEVRWQVVNTGREAASDNDLRGEFYEGTPDDGCVRWESTKYSGTHWIEAFVVKDGVCVARSGRTYVKVR